jgi:hypothetical protein
MLLHPPEVFGIVEPGIYRSNALAPVHFPFLQPLNLRTALLLSPEAPTRAVTSFLEDQLGVRFVHLGLQLTSANGTTVSGLGGDGGGGGVVGSMSAASAAAIHATATSLWRPISDELIKEGIFLYV